MIQARPFFADLMAEFDAIRATSLTALVFRRDHARRKTPSCPDHPADGMPNAPANKLMSGSRTVATREQSSDFVGMIDKVSRKSLKGLVGAPGRVPGTR